MIRISPTEPTSLRALGQTSLLPERYGVDIMWAARSTELAGIQRKVFPGDFLASRRDGRLQKELAQMRSLSHAFLLLEGHPQWTSTGELLTEHGAGWNWAAMVGFLMSLQVEYHVGFLWTADLAETCAWVSGAVKWFGKDSHHSLRSRPRPANPWNSPQSVDWQVWMLQGVPGIGPKTAEAIVTRFDGIPVKLTVTEKEMLTVPGVGKKTARDICRYLGGAV